LRFFQIWIDLDQSERNAPRSLSNPDRSDASEKNMTSLRPSLLPTKANISKIAHYDQKDPSTCSFSPDWIDLVGQIWIDLDLKKNAAIDNADY